MKGIWVSGGRGQPTGRGRCQEKGEDIQKAAEVASRCFRLLYGSLKTAFVGVGWVLPRHLTKTGCTLVWPGRHPLNQDHWARTGMDNFLKCISSKSMLWKTFFLECTCQQFFWNILDLQRFQVYSKVFQLCIYKYILFHCKLLQASMNIVPCAIQ